MVNVKLHEDTIRLSVAGFEGLPGEAFSLSREHGSTARLHLEQHRLDQSGLNLAVMHNI